MGGRFGAEFGDGEAAGGEEGFVGGGAVEAGEGL